MKTQSLFLLSALFLATACGKSGTFSTSALFSTGSTVKTDEKPAGNEKKDGDAESNPQTQTQNNLPGDSQNGFVDKLKEAGNIPAPAIAVDPNAPAPAQWPQINQVQVPTNCNAKDCPVEVTSVYVKPADVLGSEGGRCLVQSLEATSMVVFCDTDANAGLNRPAAAQMNTSYSLEGGKFIPPLSRIDSVSFLNVEGDDYATVKFNDEEVINCVDGSRNGTGANCSPNKDVTANVKASKGNLLKIHLNIRNAGAGNMWGKFTFRINFH